MTEKARKPSLLDSQPFFAKIFLLLFLVIPSILAIVPTLRSWLDGSAIQAFRTVFSSGDPTSFTYCKRLIGGDCVTGGLWLLVVLTVLPIVGVVLSIPIFRSIRKDLKDSVLDKDSRVALGVIAFVVILLVISWLMVA